MRGAINNQSAKNSATPIICACAMIKGPVTLADVPDIEDVNRILELIASIGVKVKKTGAREFLLDASGSLDVKKMNRAAAEANRSSLFLLGALAARVKKFSLYKPGGCKLGERTIRPHLFALADLGARIEERGDCFAVKAPALKGNKIIMYESGDTATENAVLAAALARGETTIKFASANYQVQDLCHFLNRAGAKISGIGTSTLKIIGVKKLKSVKNYSIMPDPIVAMTFIAAAITTGSRLVVKNCPMDFLELELYKLKKMGQKFKIKNQRLSKNGAFAIADIEIIPSALTASQDKIESRPFPGLNIDNLPLFVPILLRARGKTLVHDWAYENRAAYNLELNKLGAKISLLDPHRVWVEGPATLKAADIASPDALRSAVVILLVMLAARGKSILRNTRPIERGYENLYATLNKAGANIKIIND